MIERIIDLAALMFGLISLLCLSGVIYTIVYKKPKENRRVSTRC